MGRGALVLVAGRDPREPGGHESYVRAHALAAQSLGFEPHVFCRDGRPGVERTEFGVVHHVVGPPRRQPPAVLQVPLPAQLAWLASRAADFLARSERPRLIHGFGIYAAAGVAAARLLSRRRIPAVTVASAYATRAHEIEVMQEGLKAYHGPAHRLRYRIWLAWVRAVDDAVERRGYTGSQVVLVNYTSVCKLLVRSYGPQLNLRQIPYCAPSAFDPATPRPDATRSLAAADGLERLAAVEGPLIICVSRHDPRKGVDVLLRALHRLKAADVAFRACFIGPGKLLEVHRRLAARLGLEDRVALLGAVPDPIRYLGLADVFVLPSLGEASGSVSVLEALQCGAAIVATACDGIPEDLTDRSDALLVAPGDAGALAQALRRLLGDPSLRERLSAQARQTYERRFSRDRFVSALADVYAELGLGAAAPAAHERITSLT